MLDFGTTGNHSNSVEFVDNDDIDAVNWYVFACFFEKLTSASYSHFFGKGDVTTSAGYWIGVDNGANRIVGRHHDGSAATPLFNPTTAFMTVDSTVHSMMIAYDETGNWLRAYKDGALFDVEFSMTRDIAGNANKLSIGDAGDLGGTAMKLGHVMLWTNQDAGIPITKAEVDTMAVSYDTGEVIPHSQYLKYWVKGDTAGTIINEISQEVGTKNGTITFTANAVDAYFLGEPLVPMHREIVSRQLRRNRFSGLVHQVPVAGKSAEWELGDGINLAHWGLPRAASLVSGREDDASVKSGQSIYTMLTGVSFDPATRAHRLTLEELEHYVTTFWSTFKLPNSIDSNRDGLAQMDTGATKTFSRTTAGWIQQSDEQLATVGPGLEKFNHEGFWAESTRKNLVLNSNFGDTSITTVWTDQTAGGGSGVAETTDLLFKDTVTNPRCLKLTSGTSDSWWQQASIAVLTADGDHRVQIWHKEQAASYILSWALQRSSDSNWWNDATPGWQGSKVWNDLPNAAPGGVATWTVHYSDRVTVSSNQNWTIQVGQQAGVGGDISLVGEVDIQNTQFALSPQAVFAVADVMQDDDLQYEVDADAARQVLYAARNTIRVTFTALQNASDLDNTDVLPIIYAQFGATNANYLHAYYEKQSGSNARFAYEIVRSSSSDGKATYEIDIVRGTSYELMFRLTDNSGEELGLRARTLSVLVDGVRGTDDRATGDLSTSETHTELWVGNSNIASSLRCNNILSDLDIQQRAIPDEEALALR